MATPSNVRSISSTLSFLLCSLDFSRGRELLAASGSWLRFLFSFLMFADRPPPLKLLSSLLWEGLQGTLQGGRSALSTGPNALWLLPFLYNIAFGLMESRPAHKCSELWLVHVLLAVLPKGLFAIFCSSSSARLLLLTPPTGGCLGSTVLLLEH